MNTDELDAALYRAERRVLEIQTKLHRWAGDDRHRRFDDLYNLVGDPAFLLVAWDRVRSNKGARSAGVDGYTAYSIEAGVGVGVFLDRLQASLKDRSFRPLPVRERMIPKAGGKKRRLGIGTVISYCPSCNRVSGSSHWCGAELVERLGAMVPVGTGILWCGQARVRGLVRRAVGLRCPELVMRRRHSIARC